MRICEQQMLRHIRERKRETESKREKERETDRQRQRKETELTIPITLLQFTLGYGQLLKELRATQ